MRKLGLALGGGGARGGAHVGVLEVLEEEHLFPDLIAGTSVGGLIGALYAAGVPVSQIRAEFESVGLWEMLTPALWTAPSLLTGAALRRRLDDILGQRTFGELQRPLVMIAVDLDLGREVVLNEGTLVDAIMATTALPGAFPPVERHGRTLIDGGLLNLLPVDAVTHLGADIVIGVSLGPHITKQQLPAPIPGPAPSDEKPQGFGQFLQRILAPPLAPRPNRNLLDVMLRTFDIMGKQLLAQRLSIFTPDLLLEPDVDEMGILDFSQFQRAYTAGRACAEVQRPRLRDIRTALGLPDPAHEEEVEATQRELPPPEPPSLLLPPPTGEATP